MKITFKGDYALKAVLDLALHYNKELVTAHDMATRIDVPVKFLEQVLLELKKGGFVESKRGNIGGYLLSRAPVDITIGDIVRFIEGPIEPIACVKHGYTACTDVYKCAFRPIWQYVYEATTRVIDTVNFETLVNQIDAASQTLMYSI